MNMFKAFLFFFFSFGFYSLFHTTRICIEYTHNLTHIYVQNKLYRQHDNLLNEKEQMMFDDG